MATKMTKFPGLVPTRSDSFSYSNAKLHFNVTTHYQNDLVLKGHYSLILTKALWTDGWIDGLTDGQGLLWRCEDASKNSFIPTA